MILYMIKNKANTCPLHEYPLCSNKFAVHLLKQQ